MTDQVLLVGATGQIGRHFVDALRRSGHEVLMLFRPDAPEDREGERRILIQSLVRQGAKIIEGDLEDPSSLERACSEADAVVSCIDHRPDHLKQQVALARAAARTGRVKRIIPSQFGIDSRTYQQTRVDHGDTKRELQQEFDACGVPMTYVHVKKRLMRPCRSCTSRSDRGSNFISNASTRATLMRCATCSQKTFGWIL
jgi:uncharacterized protein YbjT (DUF2867 family)